MSNWADFICALWGAVSAYHAVWPDDARVYDLKNGLNSIAPTWSIGVAGAFWVSFISCLIFVKLFLFNKVPAAKRTPNT